MADFMFNTGLWEIDRANWDDGDGATIDIRTILWDALEADDDAIDDGDIAALEAGASTESIATSYVRYNHTTQTRTPNFATTNNYVDFDLNDAAFGAIGNGTNSTITDCSTHVHHTADASTIMCSNHDAVFTTDGSSVTIQWAPAGVWRATGS